MGFAVEVLDPVRVEHAEGQSRFVIVSLRVLLPVRFFLHSLELRVQVFGGILDGGLPFLFVRVLLAFLDQVGEYCVVDGEALHGVQLLHEFEAHGAPHPVFPI